MNKVYEFQSIIQIIEVLCKIVMASGAFIGGVVIVFSIASNEPETAFTVFWGTAIGLLVLYIAKVLIFGAAHCLIQIAIHTQPLEIRQGQPESAVQGHDNQYHNTMASSIFAPLVKLAEAMEAAGKWLTAQINELFSKK